MNILVAFYFARLEVTVLLAHPIQGEVIRAVTVKRALSLRTTVKRWKVKIMLENLQVLLENNIILLLRNYSVLGNFSGQNSFSKIVALIA